MPIVWFYIVLIAGFCGHHFVQVNCDTNSDFFMHVNIMHVCRCACIYICVYMDVPVCACMYVFMLVCVDMCVHM